MAFVEISQDWHGNTCVRVSFLIKLKVFSEHFCRRLLPKLSLNLKVSVILKGWYYLKVSIILTI